MPAKSRYSKRKPSMRKAKKMVAKTRKAKAAKNMETFFLKARTELLAVPSQGVTVSNYLALFFDLLNPTAVQGVTQNAEFNLYKNLYDKVRVNSVKMIVVPKANVFSQDAAQQDSSLTLTGDGLVHTAVDRDGIAPTNIARLQRYGSYRKYSVMKKFSRSYSIKYPTGVWLDCQNIYSDTTLLTRLGATGGITIYAENMVEDRLEVWNEPWASITLEYNCVFQGKTSASLSANDDGTITVSPDALITYPATTLVRGVRGSIRDTRIVDDQPSNDQNITDAS